MVRRTSASDPSLTTTSTQQINYRLTVKLCPIGGISSPVSISPQSYRIGDPSFNFGQILFEIDSVCDYDLSGLTYGFIGAPSNVFYDLA